MQRLEITLVALLILGGFSSSSFASGPVPCSGGVVALTFDDGPIPETNDILDALKRYKMRATFFVVGRNVRAYPHIAQRIVREGHEIANHSWDHFELGLLTAAEIDHQLRSTNDVIREVTGVTPRFARPPYASTNATVREAMANNGLVEVLWSQDSKDWNGASVSDMLRQLTLVPPGGTFVLHDQTPNVAQAIPHFSWYFSTYWAASPICAGRLMPTTNVQPVLDSTGLFYFAAAEPW